MMQPSVAEPVDNPVSRIQIPMGLKPGESFIVTPANGHSFSVEVPKGSVGGDFIEITIPEEIENEDKNVTFSKAAVGAAVVGGVVGFIVIGPIAAVVLAGGAAYCTTRKEGKIGETARKVGNGTWKGMAKSKNWIEEKFCKSRRPAYDTVPVATVVGK